MRARSNSRADCFQIVLLEVCPTIAAASTGQTPARIIRQDHPTVSDRELLMNVVTAQRRLHQIGRQLDADGPTAKRSGSQPVPHALLAVEAQLRHEGGDRLFALQVPGTEWPKMDCAGQLTPVVARPVT